MLEMNRDNRQISEREDARQKVSALVAAVRDNLSQAEDLHRSDPASPLIGMHIQQARAEFDEVVRLTYGDTLVRAYQMIGDPDEAQDVVQETYQRAWCGIHRFRSEAHFSTWLYRITTNTAKNQLQRRKKHVYEPLDDHPEIPSGDHPENEVERHLEHVENSELAKKILGVLSPRLRTVVVMHKIDNLKHGEIAEKLGLSESAVRVRFHRALGKMRKAGEDEKEAVTKSA